MKRVLPKDPLHDERREHAGSRNFSPAFLDFTTMTIYMSRFADGRLAPLHLLDGLPAEAVAKGTLIAGFERDGFFYTRRAVARACDEWRL